ncbi:hypothetical protein [Rhizobium laguerreae]|uniref:alpha-glutamyl/putrescinyl thymine pyrophosphorylase clade 3 protein n=1 Tax=Rhizobium laguerreae TaxID=1076926 RepID=UPI00103CF5B4|nr:hypothetical protein [Rhizobium laguerreae]TBY02088.1 hypothetical protein E0I94_30605 [Rhizobium laguerreae]
MSGLHRDKTDQIRDTLATFSANVFPLVGVAGEAELQACAEQLVSSMRRVDYVKGIATKTLHPDRADPASKIFDPLMAAALATRQGNYDEAWWLAFLATHFGKHIDDGWRLTQDFYGAFGTRPAWTWATVSSNVADLYDWLDQHWPGLLGDGVSRRFSNHRKYESKSPTQMKAVLGSYINFVSAFGNHQTLVQDVHRTVGQHPHAGFHEFYKRMGAVKRFGRLGTFDFLTMLGKLGIAPIEPGMAYLADATGPLKGMKQFVFGDPDANADSAELEGILDKLDGQLQVGKQVLEDALCNWQKTPDRFVLFRG